MQLGVYADLRYRRSDGVVGSDIAFAGFLVGLAEAAGGITVFGRTSYGEGRPAVELPEDLVRFVELPDYASLRHPVAVGRAWRLSRQRFARSLEDLDAVWLFGPHPLSIAFARAARRAHRRVFLGIRQHFPAYVSARASGLSRPVEVAVADALEIAFRRLARTSPTVVVGEEMRSRWAAAAPQLLATSFALVNDDDLVPVDEAGARPWHTPALALSVGRIDREKNPLLLADLVADLGPSWQLDVAGAGPLHDDLARRGNELGVGDRLNLLGLVPFGPELHRLYRAADVFVHVSLTEAVPQVLYEAMAAGTPIVATDVGGVGAALGHGTRGVLVPPRDPEALANAMRSLAADPATCLRLAQAARAEATRETLQAQADRILTFFATSGR